MKSSTLADQLTEADSQDIGYVALGMSIQFSKTLRKFLHENSSSEYFAWFLSVIHSAVNNEFLSESDLESELFSEDFESDEVFTLASAELAILAYEILIQKKESQSEVISLIANEVETLSAQINGCVSSSQIDNMDLPDVFKASFSIHSNFLNGNCDVKQYLIECNLHQVML